MEKLIILDYSVQSVECHVYDIDPSVDVDDDYIKELGFDSGYCFWYYGSSFKLVEHEEVLK